ncbi:hypothetical protein [Thermofilum sp.]|jgi:hypothetical protein|uniref:hypothetical protein n=1 Tax=Thermofilum sp. TaxID=1961369 RepID=UPI00258CD6C9|nr:hypothetical protein [Thermofilum sp.]
MSAERLNQAKEIWKKVGSFEDPGLVFGKHYNELKQSIQSCNFPMLLHGIRGFQRDVDEMNCKALMALRDNQITDQEYALLTKIINEESTDLMVSAYDTFKKKCLR